MAGWSAATLAPQSLIRRALAQAVVPSATNAKAPATAITSVVPKSTSGGNSATSVVPTDNKPDFLNGQNQSANPQQDFLDMLQQALGGQKQDPELVKAQTVLAQQQAMQVARDNDAARSRESNQAAQGYLQSQMKDLQYSPFNYSGLKQNFNDRLSTLQSGQNLNWANLSPSYFSTNPVQPRRSGWTGPAMPGTWGI